MQESHPDLQAGLDLQKNRGFLGSIAHSPMVPGAENNPFPSLGLRFIICAVLKPKVQGMGHCTQ